MHSHFLTDFMYPKLNQTLDQIRSSVESELVTCGKSVFIAKSDIIRAELKFLVKHYSAKQF